MKLRLVLGDQLNSQHQWFKEVEENTLYVFFEMRQETDYVKHHIQKVVAFFTAMRSFAKALENQGHKIIYYNIYSDASRKSLDENIKTIITEKGITKF